MMTTPLTYIVDDEEFVREALARLLASAGIESLGFPSAEEFLDAWRPGLRGCVVLDLRMPGLDGLEMQARLADADFDLPILFLSGTSDVPSAVRALKAGAADFLSKPIEGREFVARVRAALEADAANAQRRARLGELRARFDHLTAREREVLTGLLGGLSNREIAEELGISVKTIEVHRSRLMLKAGVDSFAELVQIATLCGLNAVDSGLASASPSAS
jgi:FixJ family two-component response regulator